jgi:MYXO-CTERM domain-containing protein
MFYRKLLRERSACRQLSVEKPDRFHAPDAPSTCLVACLRWGGLRMVHAREALVVVAVTLAFDTSYALVISDDPRVDAALETAEGQKVRIARTVEVSVPASALSAWSATTAELGADWQAIWDRATAVPTRLVGRGVAVPGSMSSADVAEAYARGFLRRHLALLAPGASIDDFSLISNTVHAGIRSVGFVQSAHGMRVLGGQVSFRFKNDRMFVVASEALPHVAVPALATARLNVDSLRAVARSWMVSDTVVTDGSTKVDGPFILPLIGPRGVLGYHTVVRSQLATSEPLGRWDVYVDVHSGKPVARRQTLLFGSATVRYDAPVRYPGSDRQAFPAARATLFVNGVEATTDELGVVTWSGDSSASITAQVVGPLVQVQNKAGQLVSKKFIVPSGAELIWSHASDQLLDAQLSVFVHTMLAKQYAMNITPNMEWLYQPMRATVNIDQYCNAFSDGTSINFFVRGGGCENTARLADVVYHEFGHSYHNHSLIPGVGAFDGALSEGASDYLAASMTDDPGMGRGFFLTNEALRHIDPPQDKRFPDDMRGEVHADGEIIAGALWDMRTLLSEKLGAEVGRARADFLYQAGLSRASDMLTMYTEVIAADDDDGDLTNGTPNACEINEAFGRHGLRIVQSVITPLAAEAPTTDGFPIDINFIGLSPQCQNEGVTSAVVTWERRDDPSVQGTFTMNASSATSLAGTIPPQLEGTVIRYTVEVSFASGNVIVFPQNPADRKYEFFVGKVTELYCTDFETDPEPEGWRHGLTSGQDSEGADDWQWGRPAGRPGSNDPLVAFSGDRIFGNDLGHENFNGRYQANKTNYSLSPAVEVGPYSTVRLQYWRWLSIEDARYDRATISANGTAVWMNLETLGGQTHHLDGEWRFHDVDVSTHLDLNRLMQIEFELASDGGVEFGGWNIDDFCIVSYGSAICGDGVVEGAEGCDDGADNSNTVANGCRANCQPAFCGDAVLDDGEVCDDGNTVDNDGCTRECLPSDSDSLSTSGCGCAVAATPRQPGWAALLFAVIWLARRRRAR